MSKGYSYCKLKVTYPMTSEAQIEDMDARIFAAVGSLCNDSGAGLGRRDLGWNFEADDWRKAEEIAIKVRKISGLTADVVIYGSEAKERQFPSGYHRSKQDGAKG